VKNNRPYLLNKKNVHHKSLTNASYQIVLLYFFQLCLRSCRNMRGPVPVAKTALAPLLEKAVAAKGSPAPYATIASQQLKLFSRIAPATALILYYSTSRLAVLYALFTASYPFVYPLIEWLCPLGHHQGYFIFAPDFQT
jgi:hypothetical protein